MVDSVQEHRDEAPAQVRCAVITVSDTRTLETDQGGATIVQRLTDAGQIVAEREIIPDEPELMRLLLERYRDDDNIDVMLMTGGTGISGRDQTCETISALLDKPLPGYGELLRMLSFHEIGPAAMLSRAIGGLAGRTVVLTMPGSRAAVELAMDKLILPEINHLVREATK